ncbi:hypothetical protein [Agrobacterium larrymoorei]|uniref:hypothetical protein n=1 Tax=Agrobacterium larrymoorei TaxID=160699 RepID=UPI0030C1F9A0
MADSKNIDDGGPAFPCEGGVDSGLYAAPGMSLRDYLAGQALIAGGQYLANFLPKEAAERAYQIADAMIAAREGRS